MAYIEFLALVCNLVYALAELAFWVSQNLPLY